MKGVDCLDKTFVFESPKKVHKSNIWWIPTRQISVGCKNLKILNVRKDLYTYPPDWQGEETNPAEFNIVKASPENMLKLLKPCIEAKWQDKYFQVEWKGYRRLRARYEWVIDAGQYLMRKGLYPNYAINPEVSEISTDLQNELGIDPARKLQML